MNGESRMSVDVFPWFRRFHVFCEYCAVANARLPRTPRQVATARWFGVDGVVMVFGSMPMLSAGCTRSELLSMYVPCSVWPGATVAVTLPSYRVLWFELVNGMFVCEKRPGVVLRSMRVPP